jgi:hypothetical protein
MSGPPKENEVRRLLSRRWSRRRRKADLPGVHNALHLDLNRDFEEERGDGIKYFVVVVVLLVPLIYALSQTIDLE